MKKTIKYKIVDHIFWIVLLVFTNPGGILEALGEDSSDGGINMTDLLFVVLFLCFLKVFKKQAFFNNKPLIRIMKYLIIFLFYYIFVFSFFIPIFRNTPNFSFLTALIKVRHGIINIFLVLMVYTFFERSYKLFIKYFVISSVIVITLFLITITTGMNILPIKVFNRHFIQIKRLIMVSYGIMPIFIHFGVAIIVFKFRIPYKVKILVASLLVFILWTVALLRREILGTIILFFIASFLDNYFRKKPLFPVKKMFQASLYLILLFFIIKFTFPEYAEAGSDLAVETYNVVKYGKTSNGQVDPRLGSGKKELQEKIDNNYIIGTGFDNNWRVSEDAGFEASDYPFLSAIAMAGIIGLLVFLPVYIELIKSLIFDLKFLRKEKIIDKSSIENFLFIAFMLYLIFELLQYINWFSSVSLFTHGIQKKWFILLGMYIASRKIYYKSKINQNIEKGVLN